MAGYREPIEDAQFFKLSDPCTYMPPENSHVVSRSTVRVIPQTGSDYSSNGNRVIRIVLPSTGFLDTQNSYFLFEFNNSTTGSGVTGTDNVFPLGGPHTGMATLFQRMRILVGGSVIEDINAYNLIANMLYRCGRVGYGGTSNLQSHSSYMVGYTTGEINLAQNYRDRYFQFMHKPVNGILNNVRYLPLAYIGEMTIEITLEEPSTALYDYRNIPANNAVTRQYAIRNFSYQCDILQFDSEYVCGFESSMLTRGINIPFDTFTHYKSTSNNFGDLVINHRGRNVKNLWTFLRPSDVVSAAEEESLRPRRCGLESWQLRIGAFMKPLLPVRCGADRQIESFVEFLKTLTGFNNIDNGDVDIDAAAWGIDDSTFTQPNIGGTTTTPAITFRSPSNGYFVIGVDLEREGQIASGLDTASEATPITLALQGTLPNNITQGIHMDTYIHAGANLIISSPHEVTLFT